MQNLAADIKAGIEIFIAKGDFIAQDDLCRHFRTACLLPLIDQYSVYEHKASRNNQDNLLVVDRA